jgi:hypothetical protein
VRVGSDALRWVCLVKHGCIYTNNARLYDNVGLLIGQELHAHHNRESAASTTSQRSPLPTKNRNPARTTRFDHEKVCDMVHS